MSDDVSEGAGLGPSAPSSPLELGQPAPPHFLRGPLPQPASLRPDYVLVVPSYNRPQFLVDRTMQILLKQKVPLDRVFVFVANDDERERYLRVLIPLGIGQEQVVVGVRGILAQRNFIVSWVLERYGEKKHVVSMDDDLEGLFYKVRTGFDPSGGELGKLEEMQAGGLEAWIAHAAEAMPKVGAHIWSLNTSDNPYYMRTGLISCSCGMMNGYLYGFLARPDSQLAPRFKNATEDRERSVRFFAHDHVVLRYKMYAAKTKCFHNLGGLQDDYVGSLAARNEARKAEEREGHALIEEAFPDLYRANSDQKKKTIQTMEGKVLPKAPRDSALRWGLRPDLTARQRGEGRPPVVARESRRERPRPRVQKGPLREVAHCQQTVPTASPADLDPQEQVRPEPQWKCNACTLLNEATAEVCAACKAPAPEACLWSCPTCTYDNDREALTCVMCGEPQAAPPGTWECLRCTMYNGADEASCIACDLKKDENVLGGFTLFIDSDSDREEEQYEDPPATVATPKRPMTNLLDWANVNGASSSSSRHGTLHGDGPDKLPNPMKRARSSTTLGPWATDDRPGLASRNASSRTVTFQPGEELGLEASWSIGRVLRVAAEGQARRQGVEAGWHFRAIDGRPFTVELLDNKLATGCAYTVTFDTSQSGEARPDGTQELCTKERDDGEVVAPGFESSSSALVVLDD